MKIQTSTLIDRALDYGVGMAEGGLLTIRNGIVYTFVNGNLHEFRPSTGRVGDTIIDRENISTYPMPGGAGGAWRAEIWGSHLQVGPDRRTAAMRSWVARKLGDSVEIPDELLKIDASSDATAAAGLASRPSASTDS